MPSAPEARSSREPARIRRAWSSYPVERQQPEKKRQIEERDEQHASGGARRRRQRLPDSDAGEREPKRHGTSKVDGAGPADHRRQQAHGEKPHAGQEDL